MSIRKRSIELAVVVCVVAGVVIVMREKTTQPGPASTALVTPAMTPMATGTPKSYDRANLQPDYFNAEGLAGFEEVAAMHVPPTSTESVARGNTIVFGAGNCQSCHGKMLDGSGPAGAALDPPPTDLRFSGNYKYGHREQAIYRAVFYGVDGTGMAPLEGVLTPEQIWDVAHYVRSIQNDAIPIGLPTPGTELRDGTGSGSGGDPRFRM